MEEVQITFLKCNCLSFYLENNSFIDFRIFYFGNRLIVSDHIDALQLDGDASIHSIILPPGSVFDEVNFGSVGVRRTVTFRPGAVIYNEGTCCPPTLRAHFTGNAHLTTLSQTPMVFHFIDTSPGIIEFERISGSIEIIENFTLVDGAQVIGNSPLYRLGGSLVYQTSQPRTMGNEWTYGISTNTPFIHVTTIKTILVFNN